MIKSMTGYGRCQELVEGYDITVEIRSVNHRYFEFYARVPKNYGHLEDKLKSLILTQVNRGKVEVYLSINAVDTTDTIVHINLPLAKSYLVELGKLSDALGLKNDLTLSKLTRFSDILALERSSVDDDKIWQLVQQVANPALMQFVEMRENEGGRLKEDMLARLEVLLGYVNTIEKLAPIATAAWRARLESKIRQVLEEKQMDESRIITEAAIFAEKTAVDEETVRLKSHVQQYKEILGNPDAVGRKLDFLTQEINREINTIGSKFQDIEASMIVVEMKSETEKIREQIQNIE